MSYRRDPVTKNQLVEFYSKHSQEQIAVILGTSRASVYRLMRRFQIPQRDYASASSFLNQQRFVHFTKSQEQLVYGSLLGDACLHRSVMKSNKTGNPIETYKLIFSHSVKQHEYLLHKQKLLNCCKIMRRKSGFGSDMEVVAFSHTPTLREVAKICLGPDHKKRVTPEWLAKLDWEGIAYWYQDDGSLLISTKGRPMLKFHTESYNHEEIQLLRDMLATRGLDTSLLKSPNPNPNERIICSKYQAEIGPFLRKIEPFIVAGLKYKIRVLTTDYGYNE